jgi:hypothetical protein
MRFRELIRRLEERLGYHQLPLNTAARGLRDLFDGGPLHHELMTQLVRAIYRHNACQRLDDPVQRLETFRALEPIRLQALRAPSTDIDAYRLLEELCAALDQIFAEVEAAERPAPTAPSRLAKVVPLAAFRHRRYLKSWA